MLMCVSADCGTVGVLTRATGCGGHWICLSAFTYSTWRTFWYACHGPHWFCAI